ncbi:MAG: phosphatase PAP2 family protein [Bdellovibrionaceae bacterium]|nr:phosphatase PAP2 family protein [Pseudobdellovibrionaceae bacterium]
MDALLQLDHSLFTLINSTLSGPFFNQFFPAITDLHKTWPFQVFVPALVLFALWRKYGARSILLFIGCLLCLGIADGFSGQLVKKSVRRERPFKNPEVQAIQRSPAGGYSFPSNHSLNMFAFAVYLSCFLPTWRIFLFSIAALIAYSRVYNGVHFPSDVIAGGLLGALFGLIFSRIFLFALRKSYGAEKEASP